MSSVLSQLTEHAEAASRAQTFGIAAMWENEMHIDFETFLNLQDEQDLSVTIRRTQLINPYATLDFKIGRFNFFCGMTEEEYLNHFAKEEHKKMTS